MASYLLLLLLLLNGATSCFIQNQDSGYCAKTSNIETVLPFCGKYVKVYPSVCLPKEYSYYPNSTAKSKDTWVQGQSTSTIARRSEVEKENGYGVPLRECHNTYPFLFFPVLGLLSLTILFTPPRTHTCCQCPMTARQGAFWCTFTRTRTARRPTTSTCAT